MIGTLLHFILSLLSKKTYSHRQVNIPNLYKHVTAIPYSLNRLDDTMTDLHDIHWATLRSVLRCISRRVVIIPSTLYIFNVLSWVYCDSIKRHRYNFVLKILFCDSTKRHWYLFVLTCLLR